MQKLLAATARAIVLAIYTLFSVFPLFYMVLTSFKSDSETFTTFLSFHPTLVNYRSIFGDGTFVHSLFDTLVVSALAVAIALVVGVPTAYALARFQFKGREDIAFTILSFRFAPGLLIAMPLYVIYQHLGLFDTYLGLIWVYQLIALPFIVWVLRSYFEGVSVEVEQAAYVDGYTRLGAFGKVILPLIRPGLVAAALLSFIFCWNEFTFPLVLAGSNVPIVTVYALNFFSSNVIHYGQLCCAALISALPQFILALVIQRHLVRGLSLGTVKG